MNDADDELRVEPEPEELVPTQLPDARLPLAVRVARPPLDTNLEVLVVRNIGPLRGR